MISEFGKGLTIVISAKNIPEHDWMAFSCWFSIKKNIPDAKIILICEVGNIVFRWPYKCGLKTIYYNDYPTLPIGAIEIAPSVAALRPFIVDNAGPVDVKTDLLATFVDYSHGCGQLKFEEMPRAPFGINIKNVDASINEIKLFRLWQECEKTYKFL